MWILSRLVLQPTAGSKHQISIKLHVLCAFQAAPQLAIDGDLKDYVGAQKDKKIPYAVVRGTVTPIGVPIRSVTSPSVTGVLQVIKLRWLQIIKRYCLVYNNLKFNNF